MRPPDSAASACDATQSDLHALLIDAEQSESAERLLAHVDACDRCARAIAQDRALRRALERLRGRDRAPDSLRDRVRRLMNREPGSQNGGDATGSGPHSA